MAKQKQKPARGQPISSHPLFPAVVGLWFGALFGLGSLAVRPSLIEDMVLSTRIDLIIPAAAPPLGVTARIMLALVMAALGAIVGVVMARRLTRPKPEVRERARTARGNPAAAQTRPRMGDAHRDAPACRPISVQDLDTGDDVNEAAQSDGRLAGRRRGLTVEQSPDPFVPHEFAPLPGGEPLIPAMAEMASSPALPAAIQPQAVQLAPAETHAAEPNWQPPQQSTEAVRQVFQSIPAAEPALAPDSAAAHADGRQVFGMEQVKPQSEQPRQIFGVTAQGDHLPQEFVREAGYQTSVFETEAPQPLFERDPAEQPPADLHSAAQADVAADLEAMPAAVPPADQLPSPAGLGMTDLAARLAESMRRRRAARGSAAADPASVAPVAVAELIVAAPAPDPVLPAPPPPQPIQFAAPVPAEQPPVIALVAEPDNAMPSSLRPLALDAFLEEDLEFNASLLPPRRLVASAPSHPEQPMAIPEPVPVAAQADSVTEPAEEPIAEENYASLLGLASQRTGFVRIEEPEADAAAPEPVVIFPGQAPLGQAPQFTPPAPAAPGDDSASFRRFDSPAAAEQGQPVDQGSLGASVAPEDAAQALRTALASLQRISAA